MQHTRTAIAFACRNLLLFVGLKTITNASGQMRQPYAYVANKFNQRVSFVVVFFRSLFKSPGGHAIYCRNERVIKMQNVTLWIDL